MKAGLQRKTGNGKANQCHRELVEDIGPRKRGTIIFFPTIVTLMREPVSKLQQQFSILENKVFLSTNVVFSRKRRNMEGKNASATKV